MNTFKKGVIWFLVLVGLIGTSKVIMMICQVWFNIELDEYVLGFLAGMIFKDLYYGEKLSKIKKLGKAIEETLIAEKEYKSGN